jgi:hypothetical protein
VSPYDDIMDIASSRVLFMADENGNGNDVNKSAYSGMLTSLGQYRLGGT